MFNNKVILISGGTGSFGQHFTRMLLDHYLPHKIIIVSRDEFKQSEMAKEFNDSRLEFVIGDVKNRERMIEVFDGVDYVVHAAALKQVPVTEAYPGECIDTNITGARNVISASLANNVSRVIALSSDKAANPLNTYGATKLASDKLFIAANNNNKGIRFSITRYGNVIGSRGSVIPFFKKLQNDPKTNTIPVTDEYMTRFWITLDQGVEFVTRNFARMKGGEIFVPKIPSAWIVDVAAAIAPNKKIKIVGMRPGEKLHEVMVPRDFAHLTLDCGKYYIIQPTVDLGVEYEGDPVFPEFEYSSGANPHFLTIDQIRSAIDV